MPGLDGQDFNEMVTITIRGARLKEQNSFSDV